jgi:carboxymethylenebutenolidase
VTGVAGFCLGGFYIFELARRDLPAALVGLYGFPQGMANHDPLPVPFDYLPDITRPFTMLMPAEDAAVGPDTVRRLQEMAPRAPAMDLVVYPGAGHGFLPELDSGDPAARARAEDALHRMDGVLLKT